MAPVLTLIDAGQDPEAKALFLSGQINVAACPQCGRAAMLDAPLVYHDPGKELLFTYLPTQSGASELQQQRFIGDLVSRLISSLPADQRKGYLLQPRSFLRPEAMVEAVLEADGITPEMLQAQRARAALLERLLQTADEETRRSLVEANDEQIDYDFLHLLSLNLELAEASGQTRAAQQFQALHRQLLQWTTVGKEAATREEAIRSLGQEVTREGLLEQLVRAALADEPVKVETMVAVARPAIDYVFFQQLTDRIEAAERSGNTQEGRTLRQLRETILALTEQIDAEVEQATLEASSFLEEMLSAGDPAALLRQNPDRMDGLFLDVLASRLHEADRAGREEQVEHLRGVRDAVMQLIEERQPPAIRFINRLLAVGYPDETRALLEESRHVLDETVLEAMTLVAESLRQRGQEDMASRMEQIREQAISMADLPPSSTRGKNDLAPDRWL